jgi:PhoPQ-activated pathogenicity-related protein
MRLFPMTKAAVRAMDALQSVDGGLRRFVVTGASKRGWTTWLTGAFDERVAGIVPVVFDNLRFEAQLPHQLVTWGRYSERIGDYTGRGLAALIHTPRGQELVGEVDPWSHRRRLNRLPKLVVNGTNDPYWTVDAIRLYWDGLGGEKSVLYVPNGGHGISGTARVRDATVAFVDRVGRDGPCRPSSPRSSATRPRVPSA